jgi:GT2 family glycosyltransferase
MNNNLKLAFIIPTKGRQEKLNILLDSLNRQTVKPDLLIILDSGINPLEDKVKFDGLTVKYIHTGPNSLTQARNIGIRNLPRDYHLAGFLDDDVVLCPDALEKMFTFWRGASGEDIAGVAFNVINSRKTRKFWFLKKIFFLGDSHPGNILPSGFHTAVENINKDVWTKWLPGGATVWRVDIFKEFMFDESFKGYGCMEDIDFSYRVGRKYKLISLASAKLFHKPHPINRDESFYLGYSEIVNRFYFINKFNEFSNKLFYLAALGRLLENFIYGILGVNSGYLKKAMGNFVGFQNVVFIKRDLLKDEK